MRTRQPPPPLHEWWPLHCSRSRRRRRGSAPRSAPHASHPTRSRPRSRALRESSDSAWIPPATRFAFGDSTLAANHHAAGAGGDRGRHAPRARYDRRRCGHVRRRHRRAPAEARSAATRTRSSARSCSTAASVDGDTRSLVRRPAQGRRCRRTAPSARRSSLTMHALALAGGWLAVLVVIGIGVLRLRVAEPRRRVGRARARLRPLAARRASRRSSRSRRRSRCSALGLALTILGALLIPFAVVAYILAAAGLLTLGFSPSRAWPAAPCSARTRRAMAPARRGAPEPRVRAARADGAVVRRGRARRGRPAFELFARMIAVAVTWVAATAGLGAAVVSRGGVRARRAPAARRAMNSSSWATPTPVSGVTAARRPAPLDHASAEMTRDAKFAPGALCGAVASLVLATPALRAGLAHHRRLAATPRHERRLRAHRVRGGEARAQAGVGVRVLYHANVRYDADRAEPVASFDAAVPRAVAWRPPSPHAPLGRERRARRRLDAAPS